jgi:hypothetical protein
MIVRYDELTGHGDAGVDVINPSELDVVRMIERLDQERFTIVLLRPPRGGDEHMAVGGGKGQYIVYFTPDNLTFYTLSRPAASADQKIDVTAGGQLGDYSANVVVDQEAAIASALTYLKSGTRDMRFTWLEE